MDIAWLIAEDKIKTAIKDGEFDYLPGKGKPQRIEDLSSIPVDLRMAYKVLKNSGYLPEEVELKKELVSLEELLQSCTDVDEKEKLNKKISQKQLKYNQLLKDRLSKQAPEYYEKVKTQLTE